MLTKDQLRTKHTKLRKKKYFEVDKKFFNPLNNFIKKNTKHLKYLSIYYPSNYEVNILKFFETKKIKNLKVLLPTVFKGNKMKFYLWNFLDPLSVNRYGMLEPIKTHQDYIPSIILVPLLSFDKKKNRLGYGKGYYDRYLNKYLKKNKNIITIGVAFSFQEYDKVPFSSYDVKLNYILTEKGLS